MSRIIITFLLSSCIYALSTSQSDIQLLVNALLAETPLEEDLQELCDDIGGRVTGSAANKKSVDWGLRKFHEAGVDAEKDPFEMPVLWLEDETKCTISGLDFKAQVVAKYNSPPGTYKYPIIYVGKGTTAEFEAKDAEKLQQSFVLVETDLCLDINGLFAEYSHASQVENEAGKRGVKGIIFMSSRPYKLLYRFVTSKGTQKITPQIVMAREDAMRCIRELENGKQLAVELEIAATTGPSFTSHNVIAEIPGTENPDEIVIIGSHIDSWALGTGANDNACNVAMMIDIARQIQRLEIRPKRTIRFALWNGEEQGFFGSWDYTRDREPELQNHIMAMSIDIGSGAISGFFTNGREELVEILERVLQPVQHLGDFTQLNAPIVGTDNFDFMLQGVPNLVGNHLPQVYGLNYHASSDTYDKVDLKQLKINSAIVAAVTLGFANIDEESRSKLTRQTREEIQKMFDAFQLEFAMRMFSVWEPWMDGRRGRAR